MVDTASYHRAMWYHKKRFSAWAKGGITAVD